MVGLNFLPRVIASPMWSPWPWEMVITSILSKVLCSLGQAGLPSTHGSISTVRPPRVTSLKVLWPSQVSAKPRLMFAIPPPRLAPRASARGCCGLGVAQLLEPRREVPEHRRLVGEAQSLEPLLLVMELDHRL